MGRARQYLNDINVEINVTAFRRLDKKVNNKPLYDGTITFRGKGECSYSIAEGAKGGFHKTLENVAKEIKRIMEEEADITPQDGDLWIAYNSDISKETDLLGSRGYTGHEGSYLRRPLTDSEMGRLIRAVDRRVRPSFYRE